MSSTNPAVFLHGFTQTPRSAATFVRRLASGMDITAPFLPGHGPTPGRADDLWAAARQVVGTAPAMFIGYSMGARVALHAALDDPGVVSSLVLISGTPGISGEDEREDRRHADDELARRIEAIGTDSFLREWLSADMFASLPDDPESWEDRRVNTVDGLASAVRQLGTGRQRDLRSRLDELSMPVLVIAGGRDAKFVGLGTEIVDRVGKTATMSVVPNAGHAVHIEKPVDTADRILDWHRGLRVR